MSDEPVLRLRQEDLAWRDFDGQAVLLDLRTSMYLATNAAATILWRRLEHGATEAQLTGALVDAYGIAPERAAADVSAFLTDCRGRDLLA